MNTLSISYKRHRFPPEIIAHAVWPYCRFKLRRDVSGTRYRCVIRNGPPMGCEIRARYCAWIMPPTVSIWRYLAFGRRHNTAAAKRLLARIMKRHGRTPKRFITDKLRSYRAAKREIVPGVEHRSHRGLTTVPKTTTCRFGNVKERCGAIGRRVDCSGSYRSTQPSGIASPFLPVAASH